MIVDASVAVKWLVAENDTDIASRLLGRTDLVTLDLLASEVSNAMWKKLRRGEITALPSTLATFMSLFDRVEASAPFLRRATELAVELDHPAHDCFYLSLAEQFDDRVITADLRLLGKLSGTRHAALVVGLADVT